MLLAEDLLVPAENYRLGIPVTVDALHRTQLDVEFLIEKFNLLKPYLSSLDGFRPLEENYDDRYEDPDAWQRSVFMSDMHGIPSLRLTQRGLAMLSADGKCPAHVVIFLDEEGVWYTAVGTDSFKRIEYHTSPRNLCRWFYELAMREQYYEPGRDHASPTPLKLAALLDTVFLGGKLKNDANRFAWECDRDAALAMNQRVIGIDRLATQGF